MDNSVILHLSRYDRRNTELRFYIHMLYYPCCSFIYIFFGMYLYREITSSFLFGDVMARNRIFWPIGEQIYFVYYPIISYREIKVCKFETVDMGRYHWNNGFSGTILLEQWCQWKMQSW